MTKRRESRLARRALDSRLNSLDSAATFVVPQAGWVRAIRNALGMSAAELGRRMGVSHAAVFELEKSEQKGSVRLDTLKRAAEAMDCDLKYVFIPRNGLESTVRSQAEEIADKDLRRVAHTMALEDQAEPVTEELREELVQRLIDSRSLWSRRT